MTTFNLSDRNEMQSALAWMQDHPVNTIIGVRAYAKVSLTEAKERVDFLFEKTRAACFLVQFTLAAENGDAKLTEYVYATSEEQALENVKKKYAPHSLSNMSAQRYERF